MNAVRKSGRSGRRTSAPIPDMTSQPQKKRPIFPIRTFFLTGLVVAVPIATTIFLTWSFVSFVDSKVVPLIPGRYNPETYLPYSIPGLGVMIAFTAITLLGMLTANFLGRFLIKFGESFVDRMPVIRTIYGTLKQIVETVFASNSTSFQQCCLVEYPRRGIWSLGFISSRAKGEVQDVTEDDVIGVFIPTTPNPTSGFLLFVPEKDVIVLDMTVEDGAKLVISGGLVVPDPNKLARNGRNGQKPANGRTREPVATPQPAVPISPTTEPATDTVRRAS